MSSGADEFGRLVRVVKRSYVRVQAHDDPVRQATCMLHGGADLRQIAGVRPRFDSGFFRNDEGPAEKVERAIVLARQLDAAWNRQYFSKVLERRECLGSDPIARLKAERAESSTSHRVGALSSYCNLHAVAMKRIVLGNLVVDHERITRTIAHRSYDGHYANAFWRALVQIDRASILPSPAFPAARRRVSRARSPDLSIDVMREACSHEVSCVPRTLK